MRIAIVGAGLTGLSAARHLGENPRHVTTVFETRARFGGHVGEPSIAAWVDQLARLGVSLRRTAQVERLAVDDTGVDVWIHGLAERFDLALVATSPADARALLSRSGIRRRAGSLPLGKRVYFTEHDAVDAEDCAYVALARMATEHPAVAPRPCSRPPRRPARVTDAWRSLTRRAGGLTAASVESLDLSGRAWPLDAPAVYIANQPWILDVIPRLLHVRSLRTTDATGPTTGAELLAGRSVASVVEGESHGRGAALAALAVNAPIVPLAATGRPAATSRMRFGRSAASAHLVIGEPFYPETSSLDELLDDMRMVLRHLERLAIEPRGVRAPARCR